MQWKEGWPSRWRQSTRWVDLETYAFIGYVDSRLVFFDFLSRWWGCRAVFRQSMSNRLHLLLSSISEALLAVSGSPRPACRQVLAGLSECSWLEQRGTSLYRGSLIIGLLSQAVAGSWFWDQERYLYRNSHQDKLAHRFTSLLKRVSLFIKKQEWEEASFAGFELLNRLYQDFPIYRSI